MEIDWIIQPFLCLAPHCYILDLLLGNGERTGNRDNVLNIYAGWRLALAGFEISSVLGRYFPANKRQLLGRTDIQSAEQLRSLSQVLPGHPNSQCDAESVPPFHRHSCSRNHPSEGRVKRCSYLRCRYSSRSPHLPYSNHRARLLFPKMAQKIPRPK